jgi:hypothetical protein
MWGNNKGHELDVLGNNNLFKLLNRISCKRTGWTKRTKAMEISGVGCIVHMSTQNKRGSLSETSTFVPGVKILENKIGGGRMLISFADAKILEDAELRRINRDDKDWDIFVEDDYIVIRVDCQIDTVVELSRIKDELDLMRWVINLMPKPFITKEIIATFITVANEAKGFELPKINVL